MQNLNVKEIITTEQDNKKSILLVISDGNKEAEITLEGQGSLKTPVEV